MEKKGGVFDLEKHFAYYRAYHTSPINIGAHMLVVWPNFFTSLIFLYFFPPRVNLPQLEFSPFRNLVLNFGTIYTLIYMVFYIRLDKKVGSLAALVCFMCWLWASSVASQLSFLVAFKVFLVSQVIGVLPQAIGHAFLEKRKPSKNVIAGFILAPLFALFEAFQIIGGYEPYPGFNANVKEKVDAEFNECGDGKLKKVT